MSEYTIEITDDQVEEIMRKELLWTYNTTSQHLEMRKQGGGVAMYEHDPEQDCVEISKLVSSLQVVMDYYGINQ